MMFSSSMLSCSSNNGGLLSFFPTLYSISAVPSYPLSKKQQQKTQSLEGWQIPEIQISSECGEDANASNRNGEQGNDYYACSNVLEIMDMNPSLQKVRHLGELKQRKVKNLQISLVLAQASNN